MMSTDIYAATNGSSTVFGRGLPIRKFEHEGERLDLAAEVAAGVRPFVPSVTQTALLFGVSRRALADRLKERRAFLEVMAAETSKNGNGNGSAVTVEETTEVASMPAVSVKSKDIPLALLMKRIWEATPDEFLALGQLMGPAAVWDRMISPVLHEKTNGTNGDQG